MQGQENLAVQMNPIILNGGSDGLSLDSAEISLQDSTASAEQGEFLSHAPLTKQFWTLDIYLKFWNFFLLKFMFHIYM